MSTKLPKVGTKITCICDTPNCKAEGRVIQSDAKGVTIAWVVDKDGSPIFEVHPDSKPPTAIMRQGGSVH